MIQVVIQWINLLFILFTKWIAVYVWNNSNPMMMIT